METGSWLLMLLAAFVGVAAAGFGEFGREESVVNAVHMARSLREDAELLLEIKRMITADPENVTFWWKPHGRDRTLNPCKMVKATKHYWQGIDCTHLGRERRVTAIDISGKRLAANLSPALGKLSRLKHFNASDNLFTGPVPALGKLSRLKHFDASNNLFTGPVPAHFPAGLETLDLANNCLTGAIPASLGNLQLLSTLNMSGNNLTENIPADLNLCSRLAVVDLSRNGLSGVIPTTLASLVLLTTFNVSYNRLSGPVPFDERNGVNRSSFLHNLALCGKNFGLRDCASSSSSDSTTTKIILISVGSSVATSVAFIMMVVLVYICWRRNGKGRARSSASVFTELDVKRLGVLPGEIDAAGEKVLDDGLQTLAQVRDWTMTLKWCFTIL